jgi:general secretion pathway protein E
VADIMIGYAPASTSCPWECIVATAQPYVLAVSASGQLAPRKLSLVIANPLHIADAISTFQLRASSVKVPGKRPRNRRRARMSSNCGAGRATRTASTPTTTAVVRIVDWLWQYAFAQRASGIHLEPEARLASAPASMVGCTRAYQLPPVVLP